MNHLHLHFQVDRFLTFLLFIPSLSKADSSLDPLPTLGDASASPLTGVISTPGLVRALFKEKGGDKKT